MNSRHDATSSPKGRASHAVFVVLNPRIVSRPLSPNANLDPRRGGAGVFRILDHTRAVRSLGNTSCTILIKVASHNGYTVSPGCAKSAG